jgi:hypothetical protein
MRSTSKAFLVTLAVLSARGLLVDFVNKNAAYALQALFAVGLFGIYVARKAKGNPGTPRDLANWAFAAFVLTTACSAFITDISHPSSTPWVYLLTMSLLAWILRAGANSVREQYGDQHLDTIVVWVCLALLAFATVQQLRISLPVHLSGSDIASLGGVVRPASTTGSYLHYPLILALGLFVSLQRQSLDINRSRLQAVLLFGGCLLSFSRSAALLLGFGGAWFYLSSKNSRQGSTIARNLVFAGAPCFYFFSRSLVWQRLMSSVDPSGIGNVDRIGQWAQGLDAWTRSPVFLSTRTGEFTNISTNLVGARATVLESGTLQLLVNGGIVSAIAYYALLVAVYQAVDRSHRWLRCGVAGAIAQTIVYQSVEVLPFIFLVASFPLISHCMTSVDRTRLEPSIRARSIKRRIAPLPTNPAHLHKEFKC